jgi:hypothetical protein
MPFGLEICENYDGTLRLRNGASIPSGARHSNSCIGPSKPVTVLRDRRPSLARKQKGTWTYSGIRSKAEWFEPRWVSRASISCFSPRMA